MARVVVTDHVFTDTRREAAVAARHGAAFAVHRCTTEQETADAVEDADVVLVNFAPVTDRVLARLAPGATVVRYGVGYDNVDVPAARRRGVRVANVPDYGVDTVADHTVTLLLAALRRVGAYDAGIRERGWVTPTDVGPVRGFAQTTVGLVGTGRIGLAVADRLRPFGFRVLAHDPYAVPAAVAERGVEVVGLDEVFQRSHAVSLHCPLTEETRHLVDDAALARLPEGAVLVNTARGGLVDEAALVRALSTGRLAAAGLDVFADEPLDPGSGLRGFPQVLLTPHAAFYATDSLERLQTLAAEEADRALSGRPLRSPV